MNDGRSSMDVARCPGLGWDDLVAADSREVPAFLSEDSYEYMGSEPLSTLRYTDHGFFRKEVEKMWPRIWQFAARDEDMPDPGNSVVYENVGRSYLLVRQADGSVRAFHNVCLHRGRKLRTANGSGREIRCPFHGFSWNNDGSLKNIPCRWDFPHLQDEAMALPEAEVGRWGGYIFVRDEPGGPSIEEYLAPLPQFFERYKHEDQRTLVWVGKVIHANWKAVAEAFMEAWHSFQTHPQVIGYLGDANTRYNVYGDHVNVALTPQGILSPHVDPIGRTEQQIVDEFLASSSRRLSSGDMPDMKVADGDTARRTVADANRAFFSEFTGLDLSHGTDGEMIDAMTYNVFPNFSPWGGFRPTLVYRWRPWPDENATLMEVRIMSHLPEKDRPKRPPVMKMLDESQKWTDAPELGALGEVIEQDVGNLKHIQDGLRASRTQKINLGNYQEIRIRHFHRTLDKYIAGDL